MNVASTGIQKNISQAATLCLLAILLILTGCASTQTRKTAADIDPDPLESANRIFYNINETLDRNFLKPVAQVYADHMPVFMRMGVTNFFANLSYGNVILNSFLQGNVNDGMSDTMRFVLNSTLGIGGLVDVATDIGFVAHKEDFGQTLARWGFARGAYLYIPIVQGPNSVRDVPDMATKQLLNPLTYITSIYLLPVTALNLINTRANLLDETNIRDEAALDPYAFTREAYLQQREFLIYDGQPPAEGYDTLFDEYDDGDSELIIE